VFPLVAPQKTKTNKNKNASAKVAPAAPANTADSFINEEMGTADDVSHEKMSPGTAAGIGAGAAGMWAYRYAVKRINWWFTGQSQEHQIITTPVTNASQPIPGGAVILTAGAFLTSKYLTARRRRRDAKERSAGTIMSLFLPLCCPKGFPPPQSTFLARRTEAGEPN
jgi:hypothetical protein